MSAEVACRAAMQETRSNCKRRSTWLREQVFTAEANKGRGVWVPGLRLLRRLARDDTVYLSTRSVHRGWGNVGSNGSQLSRSTLSMTCAEKLIPLAHSTPSLLSSHICRKSSFFFSEIMYTLRRPASHEGRFAIVTSVECGMRWARRVAAWVDPRADEHPDAHGQAVWSWHPGADAKPSEDVSRATGARTPVPGESSEQPSKPSRGEGRVHPAEPVVTAACFFCCRRATGISRCPAFPAPSLSE